MDRSELAKLKQKQGSTTVESNDINIKDVTPTSAVNVDAQDIYIKGVRSGQKVIKDHALLSHLGFEESGHTGFMGIEFGTCSDWAQVALTYRPPEGMLVVYTDYPGMMEGPICNYKIGNGNVYLADLPFVDADLRQALDDHINDATRHITADEREFWNNKINCIEPEVSEDLLEFTREHV